MYSRQAKHIYVSGMGTVKQDIRHYMEVRKRQVGA
jgi:hypothetical protein